jgi:hypothetical protein
VNTLSPILIPIVSVGFGIASATIVTLLYFTMRNVKRSERPNDENLTRRRTTSKRIIRKAQVASPRSEQASGEKGAGPKSKLQPVGSYLPKRGTSHGGRDEEDESE